ncbi:S-layer homology domain-containing protein [Paenibacillus aurantiacus]|uniref:S-layer homology domain-containing protein n=1 Tax=Paenibacillus aurantiacus TaxID=1936118 RepID=A0ABV5KX36_9BACL
MRSKAIVRTALALTLALPVAAPAAAYADTAVTAATVTTIDAISNPTTGASVTISGTTNAAEVIVKVISPDRTVLFYDVAVPTGGRYSVSFKLPTTASAGNQYQVVAGLGTAVVTSTFTVQSSGGGYTPPPTNGTTPPPPAAGGGKAEFKLTDIGAPVSGVATLDASKASIDGAQIVLPIGASQTVGSNALAIKLSSGTVTIPSEVLSALASLAGSDAKATISFGVKQLSNSEAAAAISKAQGSGVQMAPQGQVLELTLGVVLADGSSKPLTAFAKPIKLQLQLAAGADADLSGIYYIASNGTAEYIGGTVQGAAITAEVSHFSQYGIFSYTKNYADLPAAHWAMRAVQELTAKHVVEGVAADKFGPNAAVTRAEFLTMVVRQFKLEASGPAPFSDIQTGSWYADAVAAAYASGMVEGTGTGKFEPNKTITREEMAVMIARVHEKQGGQATGGQVQLSAFADAASISKWALEDVETAVKSGLMNGSKDGRFAPRNQASRAEAAQVLYNLLHKTEA